MSTLFPAADTAALDFSVKDHPGATADGGGTSTGTDGGSSEPGEPGGGGSSGGGDGPSSQPGDGVLPVLIVIANQDFWYQEYGDIDVPPDVGRQFATVTPSDDAFF